MNYATKIKTAMASALCVMVGMAFAGTTVTNDVQTYGATFEASEAADNDFAYVAGQKIANYTNELGTAGWFAGSEDDESVISNRTAAVEGLGSQYLLLNTDAETLTNKLDATVAAGVNTAMAADPAAFIDDATKYNGDVATYEGAVFESDVKFVASDTLDAGIPGNTDATKFAIYAYCDEEAEPCKTNLVVFHRYVSNIDDWNLDFTNEIFDVNIDVSEYTHLRVEMKKASDPVEGLDYNVFSVTVNGTTLRSGTASEVAFAETPGTIADGIWFFTTELINAQNKQVSSLNFKGTGEIDNIKVSQKVKEVYQAIVDGKKYASWETAVAKATTNAADIADAPVVQSFEAGALTLAAEKAVKIDGVQPASTGTAEGYKVVTNITDTVYAYSSVLDVATYIFLAEDGSTITSGDVTIGQSIATALSITDPSKDATAQYTYDFAGWTNVNDSAAAAIATADLGNSAIGGATYAAKFTSTVNNYTITWSIDGVTTSETLAYGATPTHANPTKEATAQYTYTFTGWDPAIADVTGNATYTAQFSETVNSYTILWTDHTGTVKSETLDYGATPTAPATAPATYVENGNIYTGTWPVPADVTGAATYAAQYTSAAAKATVISVADGSQTMYPSLGDALAAANAGDTVKLLANAELDAMLHIAYATTNTIDLAGYSIIPAASWARATSGDALLCVDFGGNLTITNSTGNGAISDNGNSGVWAAVKMTQAGDTAANGIAELTVNGGALSGYWYAITGNGTRHGTKITINGGSLSASAAESGTLAIYHPQNGVLTLNGGTLTGGTGVEMRSGSLVIPSTSTVSITATDNFKAVANGSGSTVEGVAIAISQHSTNLSIDTTVQGGTFNATGTNGKAVYICDTVNADPTDVTASLEGGSFLAAVEIADSAADVGSIIPATVNGEPNPARFSDAEADGVPEGYRLVADGETGLYKIEAIVPYLALQTAEMYINCTNLAQVIDAPAGSTYKFKISSSDIIGYSGRKDNWVNLYAKKQGTATLTYYVTNNNEQVALLSTNITVKDVYAVVDGVEYSSAQWDDAVAAALTNDKVLEFYKSKSVALAAGQSLKWKYIGTYANASVKTVTCTVPAATSSAVYAVTKTTDPSTGVTTSTCTSSAPSVMITKADGSVTYAADFDFTAANSTNKVLKSFSSVRQTVNVLNATLDLNGYTVTFAETGYAALQVGSSEWSTGSLTIKDTSVAGTGKIVNSDNGVDVIYNSSSVTIEGGAFEVVGNAVYLMNANASATISGGSFKVTSGEASSLLNMLDSARGTITVTGGSFYGFDPANNTAEGAGTDFVAEGFISVADDPSAGWYSVHPAATVIWVVDGAATTNTVAIGTATASIKPANPAKEGYVFSGWTPAIAETVTEDATYTAQFDAVKATVITIADAGATTNTVDFYASFAEAVAAAPAGSTVVLLADDAVPATKTAQADRIVVTQPITIDFGANTLSVPGSLEPTDNWCALFIDANTTLKGTTGGINCLDKEGPTDKAGVYAINVRNGATLTIEGGVYHGGGTIVQAQLGTVTVNGGTFSATPYDAPYGMDFAFNCKDENYVAGNAGFKINGGTFVGFDPQDNKAEGENTDFTSDGYVAIDDGNGNFVVKAGYNVTFDANGGSPTPDAQRVVAGGTATAPAAPAKAGCTFAGWTLNNAAYNFATVLSADIELVASYTLQSHILTINYASEDAGFTAPATFTSNIVYGAAYSVTSPEVSGYTNNLNVVAGTMGDSDVTVTVDYFKVVVPETGYAADDTVAGVTLTAEQATWLNNLRDTTSTTDYTAAIEAAGTDLAKCYLLNCDPTVAGNGGTLTVSAITVGGDVKVTVTLTRTGQIAQSINGTLYLYGATSLTSGFAQVNEAVTIGDADFSEGNTTVITFTGTDKKFFKAVIK